MDQHKFDTLMAESKFDQALVRAIWSLRACKPDEHYKKAVCNQNKGEAHLNLNQFEEAL